MTDLDDLDALEDELGDRLRWCLSTIIPEPEVDHDDEAAPGGSQPTEVFVRPSDGGTSRRWIAIAAAVLIVAGTGAVVVTFTGAERDGPTAPLATAGNDDTPSTVTVSTLPDPVPVTTVDTAPDASTSTSASGVGDVLGTIYVPTVVPESLLLTEVRVLRWEDYPPKTTRYIGPVPDGIVLEALFELGSYPADPVSPYVPLGETVTVHGIEASISTDRPGWIHITWQEEDHVVFVSTFGIDRASSVALAEQSSVDVATGMVDLVGPPPAGFQRSTPQEAPELGSASASYLWLADGVPGAFVGLSAIPNIMQHTLQTALDDGAVVDVERTTVHGIEALAYRYAPDELGTVTALLWIEDAYVFRMSGRIPPEVLRSMAEGVEPGTLAEARSLQQQLTDGALALPVLDEATLPSGAVASVRTVAGEADFLCVSAPVERCEYLADVFSGRTTDERVASFDVDGELWAVGWASGLHEPYQIHGDRRPVADAATSATGTFFLARDVPEGASFVFDFDEFLTNGQSMGMSMSMLWRIDLLR